MIAELQADDPIQNKGFYIPLSVLQCGGVFGVFMWERGLGVICAF